VKKLCAFGIIVLVLACSNIPKSDCLNEKWFIVETSGSIVAYESNVPPFDSITLGQYERYQIVSREGNFYKIKTESGLELYCFRKLTHPIAYSIKKHPNPEVLHRIAYERAKCSDFSSQREAIAAFKANPTILSELDADGDGEPCEYCYKWAANKKHSIFDYTPPPQNDGPVQVKGHYRTTKSGKKVWVEPHTRKK